MDLPNLLTKITTNEHEPQLFLAVVIDEQSVQTAVWQVHQNNTSIVTTGSTQTWHKSTEELVYAIDTSLSEAVVDIDQDINQVIFGLPHHWVEENGIAPPHKDKLKSICQQLALKPIGFVVTVEAIIHHLKEVEGGPSSAILLKIVSSNLQVSLIIHGKLLGTKTVGRSQSIVSDVTEGLARFNPPDQLPARMLLLHNNSDPEPLLQELIDHDWVKALPFIHMPQVEALDDNIIIESICLAGGAEVARSLGLASKPSSKESSTTKPPQADAAHDPQNNFGFTKKDSFTTASFSDAPASITPSRINQDDDNIVPVSPDETVVHDQPPKRKFPTLKFPKFSPKPRSWVKKPNFATPKLPGIAITGVLMLLVAAAGLAYYYLTVPTATITLYFNPQSFARQIDFTIDPTTTTPNSQTSSIPGDKQDIERSGQKSAPVTGTKTIGERASGQVEVYNRSRSPQRLDAGTRVTAGQFAFTLNDDVSLASASSTENQDFSVTLKPASSTVAVTAVDIGSQYNLPANTKFTLSDIDSSQIVAQSTSPFTGGTSQQVPAVSQEDLDNLTQSLIDEITQNLTDSYTNQSNGELGVISVGEPNVTQQETSHNLGDQASTISLSATVTQTIYTYQSAHIQQLAQDIMSDTIPPNYQLLPEKTSINILESTVNTDDTATISAQVTLILMPNIDLNTVRKRIAGQYPADIKSFLQSLPNYASASITIEPQLPARFAMIPRNQEKINLTIAPSNSP